MKINTRYHVSESTVSTYTLTKKPIADKPIGVFTTKPVRVFFRNGDSETLLIEADCTVRAVLESVCTKAALTGAQHYALLENIRVNDRACL